MCLDEGKIGCTPSTFASDIGDTTAGYQATWYLLAESGWPRATTPTTPSGKAPTPNGYASFITGMRRYLNLIHPWTTGFAKVHNAKGSPPESVPFVGKISPPAITPQAQGYDISLGGADITVTHFDWNLQWNKTALSPCEELTCGALTTTTYIWEQHLYGVRRVVSMVRPRLIHTYRVPLDPGDPITTNWQAARMWRLKVYFVPEPAGLLLLGAGIAALLGLSRMRRR